MSKNASDKSPTLREQFEFELQENGQIITSYAKTRRHKIKYPKNISKGAKIIQVREKGDRIEVLIVEMLIIHFNTKGIEWSQLPKDTFEKYLRYSLSLY